MTVLVRFKNSVWASSKQGSTLLFTLFILLVLTVMALGMFSVSFLNYGMSMSTSHSVSSLQTADTAIELALQAMRDAVDTDDRSIGNVANLMCPLGECGCLVSNGIAQITDTQKTYEITFKDKALLPEPHPYFDSCATSILDVYTIRSVGTSRERRVIEVEPHINPCSITNELSFRQQNPVTEDDTPVKPPKATVACGVLAKNDPAEYKIDPNPNYDRKGDVCPWHVPTMAQLKIFDSLVNTMDPAENGRYYWTNTPEHSYVGCTPAMSWKSYRFPGTEDFFCYSESDLKTKDPTPVDLSAYVRCVR